MAEQPVKDLLDDDNEDTSQAGASGDAGGGAGKDGLEVQFSDDAFDPEGSEAVADAGAGDAAGDVGDAGAGDAGAGADDDDALSAGGEDEAPGGNAADAEDLDDEAKGYSANVQKRIQREQRATRRAREEANAERAQRIVAQKEAFKLNKNMLEVLGVTVANEIKAKLVALKAAKEAGDSSKEVDIQQELAELNTRMGDINKAKPQFEKEPDFEGAAKPNELAATWKERNKFFGHPKFKAETALVKEIDLRLSKTAGVSSRSPEYFRLLDQAIAADMPDLRTKVKTIFKPVQRQQTQQRVAAVQTRGTTQVRTQAGGSKRVLLNKQDVANMVTFKLDPKNPEHVKQYAREKMEAA
jgi:hypothetical protein